jgi:hypothetical protein
MMPPTSIDGTDITGATIDGTEVQEITVDGQTVFSAQTLPVAYSNLVAWYPFDSAEYGGSNADDVTALFNPGSSGDSTGFDGTVNGATYQSTAGNTDINAGANSGAFSFDGGGDNIDMNTSAVLTTGAFTVTAWFEYDGGGPSQNTIVDGGRSTSEGYIVLFRQSNLQVGPAGSIALTTPFPPLNTLHFFAFTFDGSSTGHLYLNAGTSPVDTNTSMSIPTSSNDFRLGTDIFNNNWSGLIEDVRYYHTELTGTQVDQIYQNTKP